MNKSNLKPNSERTPSERQELARKAGKASGESRRERKRWREELSAALMAETETALQWGAPVGVTKNQDAMIALADKCAVGDLQAIKIAAGILGEDVVKSEIGMHVEPGLKTRLNFEDLIPQETYIKDDNQH